MLKRIIIGAVLVLVLAGAYVGYSFFRTPEEASALIEAVPLVLAEDTGDTAAESPESNTNESTTVSATAIQATADTTMTNASDADVNASDVESNSEAEAAENASDAPTTGANEESAAATLTVYEIVQTESQARFYIDEVLRGAPVTVAGITDQVAGQIALNPGDLSTAQIGTILVNARTLATDNDFRNRAIKNQILLTDDHEFVAFEPTEIVGLSESGSVGEGYSFQIVGDLTITGSTQEVTFDATVTPTSETRLEGTATATILYADFGVAIPAAQSVDAVEDELRLEIDFVAEAVSEDA